MTEKKLKRELIEEVSEVRASNLRRVESSSGMKTIFSSDDYFNRASQPRHRHHGHSGHHNTPQSPGRNRIKVKHHDHKIISTDLFEKPDKDVNQNHQNPLIDPFMNDPLATSTLKPPTAHPSQETNGDSTERTFNGSFRKTTTNNVHNIASAAISNNNGAAALLDNSTGSSSMFQNTNVSKIRGETEMTLPETRLHHTSVMSSTESTMTEEDDAIQELLTLAEGQEAALNAQEALNTSGQEANEHGSISNRVDRAGPPWVSDHKSMEQSVVSQSSSNMDSDKGHEDMAENNTEFDLKEIVSSTPQTGSMYEDTPSEEGSTHSGAGQRVGALKPVESLDMGIETVSRVHSLTHTGGEKSEEHLHMQESELNVKSNGDYLNLGQQNDTPQNDELAENAYIESNRSSLLTNPEATSSVKEPSQHDIEETQKQLNNVLADLSTSMEEDFSMEEKSIGEHLSSEADVIVHSSSSANQSREAETLAEFAHLHTSRITSGAVSSTSHTVEDMEQPSSQHYVLPESTDQVSPRQSEDNEKTSEDDDKSTSNASKFDSTSEKSSLLSEGLNESFGEHQQDTLQESIGISNMVLHTDSGMNPTDSDMNHTVDNAGANGAVVPTDTNHYSSKSDISTEIASASSSHTEKNEAEFYKTSRDSEEIQANSIVDIASKAGVYTGDYQTAGIEQAPKISVAESESSRVYETTNVDEAGIGGSVTADEKILLTQDSQFNLTSDGSKTLPSGRLSPIGAEGNISEKMSVNKELPNPSTDSIHVYNASSTTKSVSTQQRPEIAGSFLSSRKPGAFKSKSDFQTLTENVDVKGLAKHLEKSLDFSKMIRGQQNEDADKESGTEPTKKIPSKVKTNKLQDPKDAFGQVLSDLFQKTKSRSVNYEALNSLESKTNHIGKSIEHDYRVDVSGENVEMTSTTNNPDTTTGSREQVVSMEKSTNATTESATQAGGMTEISGVTQSEYHTSNEFDKSYASEGEDTEENMIGNTDTFASHNMSITDSSASDTSRVLERHDIDKTNDTGGFSKRISDNDGDLKAEANGENKARMDVNRELFPGETDYRYSTQPVYTEEYAQRDDFISDNERSQQIKSTVSYTRGGEDALTSHDENLSDSEQDESFVSLTTLQDNDDQMSDLSYHNETAVSRYEQTSTGREGFGHTQYTGRRSSSAVSSISDETFTEIHEEILVPLPQPKEDETYTEVHEEILVPMPKQYGQVQSAENVPLIKNTDPFPSYRERFLGSATGRGEYTATDITQVSTKTFQHAAGEQNVTDSGARFDSSINSASVEVNNVGSTSSGERRWAFQNLGDIDSSEYSLRKDTVQGSSIGSGYNTYTSYDSAHSASAGYSEKPARQVHGHNSNITKKGDRSDHVTLSSSSPPRYAENDVTKKPNRGEEFVTRSEKLSENAFSSNYTSEPRKQRYVKSQNDGAHSLFYDGSADDPSVESVQDTQFNRNTNRGNKYTKGSMAYLLTGKEHVSTDFNRSGRSTPQRKDLYVEEDILVSPTSVDERRGSHSSRDYLADNHGGQDFFHFNMNSPSNYDREGTEGRSEQTHSVEKTERRTVHSGGDHLDPLPDTYIGKSKAPEAIPIRIQTTDHRPVQVSQTPFQAYSHSQSDVVDRGKHPESKLTERTTTYVSSHNHNGTDGNRSPSNHTSYPQESNVIRIETHSTGPEASRRERRDVSMTSHRATGKHSAEDNRSISSLSSNSSASVTQPSSSRNHRVTEKRTVYKDSNIRVHPVSVDYASDGRIHSNTGPMPHHVKTSHDNRVYHVGKNNADPRFHPDHEHQSNQDVRYLIKSLERETKQPRRPIPGMVGDAFSYHVTSSGNENKSPRRNNHVNEVDVTSREAMRDRERKDHGGSSQVVKSYKEERIVEDVTPSSSFHVSPKSGHQGGRTIVLENGQAATDRPIVFHPPPSSLDRTDSDITAIYDDTRRNRKREKVTTGETTYYVDSSASTQGTNKSEKIRLVNKGKKHHKGHSLSSDDNSSDDDRRKHKHTESGKVSTVLYDFSSDHHPSLSNVVHLEGAKGLKTKDSQEIYSTPRNTGQPFRARSSSESSMSDHGHKKGKDVKKKHSDELYLSRDLNKQPPRNYKSENVFYEHYHVKRDNPMYRNDDKIVYVGPHAKGGARSPSQEIYVDSKHHSPARQQLSSSFSSISPTGSPTPEDRHVTTVSFDESFNRKRSASPVINNNIYQPKIHVKKHRVVKTDEQIIRPAESDNELYVRGSRSSPYRVAVKGDRHRNGRNSDTDESFYSDSRTTGSHRSTINISRAGGRKPDPTAPAVMSIPLSNEPVAMTIPAVHQTKYVTNKSERMELKRSASMDSIRDMVDYPVDMRNSQNFRSEKQLHLTSSSDGPSSPEMRSPNSPYVSTITILNRKLDVKEPEPEEVVYATKEVPRETKQERRSEKHTTYTTYEEYRNNDNFEYVTPTKQHVTTVRQQRQIPIREEPIRAVREDRAKAVRDTLHEKFTNMSYEESQEPQQVEQKSSSDLKVVRGQFVIRNSMDIDLEEGDSLTLDDNINIFDNSFTMNKENPLYQSDPDIYKKFESETVEERTRRIREHDLPVDEVDALRSEGQHVYSRERRPFSPSHVHRSFNRRDLDVPHAEGEFGEGFEDIIQNTRQAAVKASPNKKKQNLSQLLLSKLAQIDSKDITQHIDVEHHNEEIYGDIKFIHADGTKAEAMDTTNFDSVSEHIDLMLKEGKALITIKVTAERIIPVDFEFNVWRKSQAIVTRNIEIDLKANDQRRRLYEHVMETTPRKMIASGSSRHHGDSSEAVLSSRDTLKLFSRLLSVAEKDEKAVERDEVRYETKHRERSDSLPSLSNADMLY